MSLELWETLEFLISTWAEQTLTSRAAAHPPWGVLARLHFHGLPFEWEQRNTSSERGNQAD